VAGHGSFQDWYVLMRAAGEAPRFRWLMTPARHGVLGGSHRFLTHQLR